MKKLISLLVALVLVVTCLAGISFAADPLFEVTNGSEVKTVDTVADMIALINENGKTKVKLLRSYHHDVSDTGMGDNIAPPYSCELDLNGFILSTDDGNAWSPMAAGTENAVSVVKNGTLWTTDPRLAGQSAIRIYGGALRVENVVAYAPNGMTIANYVADTKYNEDNLITDCVLVSGNYLAKKGETSPINCGWCGFGFNLNTEGSNQTGLKAKIENTTILAVKPTGTDAFAYRKAGNTVELGKNVKIYTYHSSRTNNTGLILSGEALVLDTSKTYEVDVPAGIPAAKNTSSADITKYTGLTLWATPTEAPAAPVAPVVPETPAAPATPAAPETPAAPATPSVPSTNVPDVEVPKTGASVIAMGVMAMVSLAGAVITKKH